MIVAVDHEYVAADAAMGDVPGSRPDVQKTYCEVMQVGACKYDTAAKREVAVLNLTVRAHRLPDIPPWLSEMTGMSAERRARDGVPFSDALAQLAEFCAGATAVYTFAGDWFVLEGNCQAHGIESPFHATPFTRVKPLLVEEYGVTVDAFRAVGFGEMCSGGLHRVLGIDLPDIVGVGAHDAAHDARSLAHSIARLRHSGTA